MVKEINPHEIREAKCILRDEKSKEPSQGKGKTETGLIRCLNQKHGRKELEQNLTARGVAKVALGTLRPPSLLEQNSSVGHTQGMHCEPHYSRHAPSATSLHRLSTAQEGKLPAALSTC